jgi:cell shape-determining protein MreC
VSALRFSQTFFALMVLSFVSAFILPQRVTDLGRTPFEALLIPISRPSYRIANAIRGHFVREAAEEDTRPAQAIEQENLVLKQQVQIMSAEIERLAQRADERERLGGFESLCERFEVAGTDSDNREGLTITGSGLSAVRVDEPVLSSGTVIDLVGQIDRVGALAAHAVLVTNMGFAVTGHFFSVSPGSGAVENKNLLPIVRGEGDGNMVIDNLSFQQLGDSVHAGDWVVLSDNRWPQLHGVRVGRIASISPLPRQTLFAEIRLAQEPDIMHLNDVWVMTRRQ